MRSDDKATKSMVPLLAAYLDEQSVRVHEQLGDVAGVAVTVGVDGAPITVGSSTQLALDVDLIQYQVGTGPCLNALREGVGAYVPDLGADRRWGEYGPLAAARGAVSCISVPIIIDGTPTAVLKVYSSVVDGLSEDQREQAGQAAPRLVGGISLAKRLAAQAEELDDRSAAMDSRRVIDLAIGITMERARCDPDQAFDLLRRQSQKSNTKLVDCAREVVSGLAGSPAQDRAPFRSATQRRRAAPPTASAVEDGHSP